jgi:Tol biopolymer transport system component
VPSQLFIVRPDGTERRAVTSAAGNSAFPGFAPDGRHIVFRYRTTNERGLRILDLTDSSTRVLTNDDDDLPAWSPTGERIAFTRAVDGGHDIFSIRPDGTDLRRLTNARGQDAHGAWSPDGRRLLFASSRLGFRDESPLYYDWAPQPYAELFVMNADGSEQRPLTDNKWEDGTAAWLP